MHKKIFNYTLVLVGLVSIVPTHDALAQRGRGGGGFRGGMGGRPQMPAQRPNYGGGGGNFGGGGFGGGNGVRTPQGPAARPNYGAGVQNRATQAPRNFDQTPNRPGNFPNAAGGNYQRPTGDQLSSFLGNGYAPRSTTGARPPMAAQLPTTGGSRSATGPNGGSVQVDRGAGSYTGPRGNTVAGAGRQTTVTGPDGNSATRRTGVAGATNGENSAIAGRSTTVAQGDRGTVANTRSAYANTLGAWGLGGATVAQGRNGYTAVNVRGATGVAGVGARAGSVTAVRGPNGGTVVHGRGASYVNGQFVHGNAWGAVNGSYHNWHSFYGGWHQGYPGCWWPGKWAVATTAVTWAAWMGSSWGQVAPYVYPEAPPTEPVYYDYGDNVTYQNGNVYYGDADQGTSAQYYDAALQSAKDGDATPKEEEWFPLGVFAVVEKSVADQTDVKTNSQAVLQLAINKEALVRGNFQKSPDSNPVEVRGTVDKDTQRVLIHRDGDENTVLETGLYNLTNDEAPALLHLGADKQTELVLVRLQNPNAK